MSRTLHVSGNEQNRDTGWHRDPTPKTTLLSVQRTHNWCTPTGVLLVNIRECHWFYGYEYLSQYRNHASHRTPVLAFLHSVLLHTQESANTKRPVIRKLSTRSVLNHLFRQWYSPGCGAIRNAKKLTRGCDDSHDYGIHQFLCNKRRPGFLAPPIIFYRLPPVYHVVVCSKLTRICRMRWSDKFYVTL
ncbi:unnamed protein product [Pylaiella littoralis]